MLVLRCHPTHSIWSRCPPRTIPGTVRRAVSAPHKPCEGGALNVTPTARLCATRTTRRFATSSMLGARSRWSGYLQSLPRTTVEIALLWGLEDVWDESGQGQEAAEDARQAALLAAGTEIENELLGEEGVHVLSEIRQYYSEVVLPELSRPSFAARFPSPPLITFAGFVHAYSLVSSRSFLVDAHHLLAMVPIADAFNHTLDNHVHLESEFDVCVTCGSLAQCPHDQEDEEAATVTNGMAQAPSGGQSEPENGTTRRRGAPSTCEPHAPAGPSLAPRAEPVSRSAQPNSASRGTPTEPNAEIDTCDMVCNLPIAPWTEVFNTYGEHLTNAQLLARYGFALDGNDNDVVTLRPADLSSLADVTAAALRRGRDTVGPLYRDVLEIFPRYDRWEGSSLVYQPDGPSVSAESGASSGDDGRGRPSHGHGRRMCVNSDARVSHALWVYCATLAVLDIEGAHRGGEPPGAREVAAALRQLAGCQLALEARSDAASSGTGREADADDDEGDGDLPRHEGTVNSDKDTQILAHLARSVTWACTRSPRAARLGRRTPAGDPPSAAALGAMLDDLPRGHTKTRRALAQVLAERSVLDSCGALWADFRAALFSDAGITIASSGAEHASRVSADARGALGVAGRTALGLLAEYASDEDGDGE